MYLIENCRKNRAWNFRMMLSCWGASLVFSCSCSGLFFLGACLVVLSWLFFPGLLFFGLFFVRGACLVLKTLVLKTWFLRPTHSKPGRRSVCRRKRRAAHQL